MSAPLQNRVDPFGELFATPARGLFMGNRGGRFHTDGRKLTQRRWASRQWICCVLDFKGRQRDVWGRYYTELFFLDEVTALAAGHRPCFECRRKDAEAFAGAWQQAFRRPRRPRADEMDLVLHAERLEHFPHNLRQSPPSCPRLSRASTPGHQSKAWMAGTSPAMTTVDSVQVETNLEPLFKPTSADP